MDEIREKTINHLNRIDKSDSILVVAGDECHRKVKFKDGDVSEVGYVGISTSMEMGYAHGKDKPIFLHWKNNHVPIQMAMNECNIIYFHNMNERLVLPLSEASSIALQTGYAFAFNKPIYLLEPIRDVNNYPVESVSRGAVSVSEIVRRKDNV